MNNSCYYLGKKEGQAYCRKPQTKACPQGKITTCPCIPADFWNVAQQEKKKQDKSQTEINMAADRSEEENIVMKTKMPAAGNLRPASIREWSVFKTS